MQIFSRLGSSALLSLALLLAPDIDASSQNQDPHQASASSQPAQPGTADKVFRGDFDQIKQRGRLRIVVPANVGGGRYLPRKGSPVSQQFDIAEAFARYHGLVPELVITESFSDMIPLLVDGKADIVVGNLTVTDSR